MTKIIRRIQIALAHSNAVQAWNTVLNSVERRLQKTRLNSKPFMVQVEVTNKCNLNCIFCSRHGHALNLGDLSPDLFPEIVKMSRKSRELLLFGYGEPLIAKAFHELSKQGQSARFSFVTNGVLLDNDMLSTVLNESNRPIQNIAFSIDGAEASTYISVRERSDFDKVWTNLERAAEYKAQHNLEVPELWINFVAMRRNIEELPALITKAGAAGVSQINVFHLVVWDEDQIDESLVHHPELTRRIFSEAEKEAKRLGIRLDMPTLISLEDEDSEQGNVNGEIPKCYQPWSYAYVRHDGFVQACCFSEKFVMGNLNEKTFEEIWNDKPYQEFRALVNKRPPPECQTCELRYRYTKSPNDAETYIKLNPRSK